MTTGYYPESITNVKAISARLLEYCPVANALHNTDYVGNVLGERQAKKRELLPQPNYRTDIGHLAGLNPIRP